MGKKSRRKGGTIEREIVNRCKEMGLDSHRVPLSGAVDGYKGDVIVGDLRCEVKGRAKGQGFAVIERWLGDFDVLFLRRDRQEPLIVLPWATWKRIMHEPRVGIVGAGLEDAPVERASKRALQLPSRD